MTTVHDGPNFYMRGEGAYNVAINVIPIPKVAGSYKVTKVGGTTIQMFPRWDSPEMPNGWLALNATVNVVGLIAYQDETWLVLEKNAGFVNAIRVTPV
jgi:hypothetical protein